MRHYERAWAEIDLDALQFNIESIKNSIDKAAKIIAVIKTAYPHTCSSSSSIRAIWMAPCP